MSQSIRIAWDRKQDAGPLCEREWLLTNGLGGYASGTLLGIATRRYHGLFVPNLSAPKGRHVLISRYDEEIDCAGRRIVLGGSETEQGEYQGAAQIYLREFKLENQVASWIFDLGDAVLERAIVMPYRQNTVCVRYRLLQGERLALKLRPFLAFRRQDGELNPPGFGAFTLSISGDRYEAQLLNSDLRLRLCLRPNAKFVAEKIEVDQQLLRVERSHGYLHHESLASLGYFDFELAAGESRMFMASTHAWERLDFDADAAFHGASRRVDALLETAAPGPDAFAAELIAAADQFIVLPGSRLEETVTAEAEGGEVRTVIAGYHWFGDWGRDTMISLEGLTLCTGRVREARAILQTFAHYVADGLLPNLFPEGERQGLYHTVDATLWYFHAIDRYLQRTQDVSLLEELFPVLRSIFEHHMRGTHFGIHVDSADGLLAAGAEGYQLTWMDAKVDGWVVTPRRGKPVEIQALWYNALRLMEAWSRALGRPQSEYSEQAARARQSFNARCWNAATQCLFDVLDGEGGDDPSIRPNQIFAISLPHPILDEAHWGRVVDTVQDKLLTPYGLRTLNREHPDYKSQYQGNLRARDAAYHQGTVWPWLIGHFIDAWLKVHADRKRAHAMLAAFPAHLRDAGIGSINEIFYADAPHRAAGCIAQAWSVAEVLRAWLATR